MIRNLCFGLAAVCAALSVTLVAQEPGVDRTTVQFSDPSGAKRLQCSLLQGGITVKAHASRDVIVEAKSRGGRGGRRDAPPGMRRISGTATGLVVEEASNVVKVSAASHDQNVDVTIFVPADTSVKLGSTNNGSISVEGISGEIDVNNLNGSISITNVSGAVIAHSLNGKLIVSMNQVTPNKAMSFSTLNGDVDVTLPADVKANLKMKSENGDIFSDFEILLKPSSSQPVAESSGDKKRYKIKFDRAMTGTINGGGPDMSFTTLNGTIFIRQKK
jgi:hypothetical protein